MLPTFYYEVVNAHAWRQCHPETCCCSTNYLVVNTHKDAPIPRIVHQGDRESCQSWIEKKKMEYQEAEDAKRKLNFLNKVYDNQYFEPIPIEVKRAAKTIKEHIEKKGISTIEGLQKV